MLLGFSVPPAAALERRFRLFFIADHPRYVAGVQSTNAGALPARLTEEIQDARLLVR
jgi:hypothetical protein